MEAAKKSDPKIPRATWIRKFKNAIRGLRFGMFPPDQPLGLNSFVVHALAAALVMTVAWAEGLDRSQVAIMVLCIAMVFVAELFNTAIERLARAVTREFHPDVRDALDVASGAVLTASGFAIVVAMVVYWLPVA